jgi:transcriptional regulator of aroF, aroG, tyrA and aromatic amino acid transport
MKGFDALVAVDKQMIEIINRAKHLCNPHVPLVISGEAGVGKKTIAKAIHFASERKNKLFSSINCSTSKQAQMMEDLFGLAHPRYGKAGILEITDGGTVYINDVQDLSQTCQSKLLHFIQANEFKRVGGREIRKSSVKLIVSSSQTLNKYVENNQMSDTLFYALDVTQLSIPALRERKDDIEPLITGFLLEFKEQGGKVVQELSFAALNKLKSYYWPGNITQLKDIVYKACLLSDGQIIEDHHIEIDGHVHIQSSLEDCSLPQAVAEFEKHFLQHWYQKYPSTRKLAAQLGVSHTTIAQKLNKYNLA